MGTIQFVQTAEGDVGLYDHEGYLTFSGRADQRWLGQEWFTAWGHEAWGDGPHSLGLPGKVRAACDCGWHGPTLPWGQDYPSEEQYDALMLAWEQHVEPLIAEIASR